MNAAPVIWMSKNLILHFSMTEKNVFQPESFSKTMSNRPRSNRFEKNCLFKRSEWQFFFWNVEPPRNPSLASVLPPKSCTGVEVPEPFHPEYGRHGKCSCYEGVNISSEFLRRYWVDVVVLVCPDIMWVFMTETPPMFSTIPLLKLIIGLVW